MLKSIPKLTISVSLPSSLLLSFAPCPIRNLGITSGATDVDSSTAPKHIRILVSLDGKVESRSMHFMYTCIGLRNAHQPNVSPRTSQVQQPNAVRGQGRKTWLRRLSLVSYVGCAHSLLRFIICKSSEERITRNTT